MEQQGKHWVLKREIQVGHLISTVVVAASVFSYVLTLERRIALVEQQVAAQREVDAKQDVAQAKATDALTARLDRIEAKLDRLIEKYQGVRP